MATKEHLHELIDQLPVSPETERRLAAAEDELVPNGTGDDSATMTDERRAALKKLAEYFEHPETAPWDWDVLRDIKQRAWRV